MGAPDVGERSRRVRPGNRTAGTGISRGAMSETVDPAIIGAGPAGMSAAIAAREHGADVLVLDEQVAPGGQIYRNVETVTAERPETARVLGEDYASGARFAGAAPNTRRVPPCGR